MANTPRAKVPVFIWFVIVVLLAALYGYAAYWDPNRPEKTVQNFYQAYFTGDYKTVSSNLSVFWAVRLLPQYADMDSVELLTKRAEIEENLFQVISEVESMYDAPRDISIQILKPYTKEGTYSAVVVYKFMEKSKEAGMEAAILIKEQGKFRIFTMTPVDEQSLSQIKAVNISELDANFLELQSGVE
ncbi:MAG TPA: hypothetical protein PLC88_03650 [Syntrophomonas sp.]|nr:hypothetical protein [Syntrophomonas sp.]HRW12185.1 hypothetical protein [Syntrophomonas sp.]